MIIPFAFVDGNWTLSDSVLSGLWKKMETQRLHERTFKDGDVKTEDDFLKMMKSTHNIPVLCVDDEYSPAMIGWINGTGKKFGFGHFFVFREFWGRSVEFGNQVLDYWFSLGGEDPVFETLVGLLRPENQVAVHYSERLGFRRLGEIPSVGVVMYKTRGEHGKGQL